MKLLKFLNSVTPFSKILIIIIFIVLLLLAFYIGIYYQRSKQVKTECVTQEKVVKVFPTETKKNLIRRCGDYPLSVVKATPCGQWNYCGGPMWSPDCRYISWSLHRAGPSGWLGPEDPGITITPFRDLTTQEDEGVFLYNDKTNTISTIYHNKTKKEAGAFQEWKDSNTIVYTSDSGIFYYDVSTGQITSP